MVGLFLIVMTCKYGEIVQGVGILMMFSFVWMMLGIMVKVPPLAEFSPEYLFWVGIVVFELLYIIL